MLMSRITGPVSPKRLLFLSTFAWMKCESGTKWTNDCFLGLHDWQRGKLKSIVKSAKTFVRAAREDPITTGPWRVPAGRSRLNAFIVPAILMWLSGFWHLWLWTLQCTLRLIWRFFGRGSTCVAVLWGFAILKSFLVEGGNHLGGLPREASAKPSNLIWALILRKRFRARAEKALQLDQERKGNLCVKTDAVDVIKSGCITCAKWSRFI